MAKRRGISNDYRELCSGIRDIGQMAQALEGVMESLASILEELYAVLGGAAEFRRRKRK